ncbi:MAG: lysophospholipid acyltransferase family protein [Actinobacteria bacterium]|nr:lysophospholipid acyltransferase family protein [Actinomycetota bacterium]
MLIFLGYKFVEFLAFATPYPLTYLIASVSARILFNLNINVDALKTNVANVLNLDKNDREVTAIARKIFINWFVTVADFLKHTRVSKEKLKQRIEITGLENLDKALEKGKGVVIFTAHIGNVEWGACRVAAEGYNICVAGLHRPYEPNNKFFESRRLAKGVGVVYVNKSLLNIFRILKNNEIIAIAADWDSQRTAHVHNFFGKKAYIPSGPVEIAMKSGASLIPCCIYRKNKYNHFMELEKPLELETEGEKKELIDINTAKMAKVLQKYIKEHLDQWEMFHDIWA